MESILSKDRSKTDDFNAVLKTIKQFLTKPFTAAVKDEKFTDQWYSNENKWNKEIQK